MLVTKSKLKARMLEYFREVERTGESLIVTDHGREVLEAMVRLPWRGLPSPMSWRWTGLPRMNEIFCFYSWLWFGGFFYGIGSG
jgi:hypothetical protein